MKIKELQKYLRQKNIDIALFITKEDKREFNLNYFSQSVPENGYLIIPKKSKPILFVSALELGEIKASVNVLLLKKRITEELKSRFKKIKTIGINGNVTTVNELKLLKKNLNGARFKDISHICERLREEKTKKEIKIIKKACSITDKIMQKCVTNFRKFATEEEVIDYLKDEARKAGCIMSWEPVVASGPCAAIPHHKPGGKLRNGFCIIDFGVVYRGYNSDMTRTIYLGRPSTEEIKLYSLVLQTQQDIISHIKPGIKTEDIDKKARQLLGDYSKYFIHNPGHGIGINIHEMPFMGSASKGRIKKNSTIAIEPGIYIKDKLGIRIEDDILVTRKCPQYLTRFPKDLICIVK